MRAPYKLGLGALGVLLVVTTRMMMERPSDVGDAPVPASRSGVTQRSLADDGARERSAHGLGAPSDVAVALQPRPGPSAVPGEVEYDDSMTELVRMTLAGDEHLTQYWHHRSAPLMSEVDRAAYRDLLSDPEMHEKVRRDLRQPEEDLHSEQRNLKQLIQVDYLRDALAWQDNPLEEELLAMIAGLILEDSFRPGMNPSMRRTLAMVKMELYQLLHEHAPDDAQALVEQARGTRLEGLLAFLAQDLRQREQAQVDVEKIPPTR